MHWGQTVFLSGPDANSFDRLTVDLDLNPSGAASTAGRYRSAHREGRAPRSMRRKGRDLFLDLAAGASRADHPLDGTGAAHQLLKNLSTLAADKFKKRHKNSSPSCCFQIWADDCAGKAGRRTALLRCGKIKKVTSKDPDYEFPRTKSRAYWASR